MSDFEQPIAKLRDYEWSSIEHVSGDYVEIIFKPKPRKDFKFRIPKADIKDFVEAISSSSFDGGITIFNDAIALDDRKNPDEYSVYEGRAIYDTKPWEDE